MVSGAEVGLGGVFHRRLARDMAIAKGAAQRGSYRKPASPRTGRFNARGRAGQRLSAASACHGGG